MEKRIKLFAVCISCLIATSLLTWTIISHFYDRREDELRYNFELERMTWQDQKRDHEETISYLKVEIGSLEGELLENQELIKKMKKYLKAEKKILEKIDKQKKAVGSLMKEIDDHERYAK